MSKEYNKGYTAVKDYVIKSGIPRWFWNLGEDWSRGVFKAINDFGVLSEEEELVYNKIVYNEDEHRVWYQGGWKSTEGYTDEEIRGVKKYMAHSYVLSMQERESNG